MTGDGDITKLPKWAQRRIETLEANVDYWQKQAASDIEKSDTGVYRYGSPSTRLAPGTQVRFQFKGGDIYDRAMDGYLDVRVRDGWVELYASEPLLLRSHSSNIAYVKTERH